jgi:carbamoyltransferase
MNVLGIYGSFDWRADKSFNEYNEPTWCHDSGATLFINGNLVSSIAEERLTRNKHDGNFPINSINYCLGEGNITGEDIDYVYVPSMCVTIWYKKWYEGKIESIVKEHFPNAQLKFVSHHLSHACASIFSCDYNEGSFVTLDGAGSIILNYHHEVQMAETSSIGYFNKEKGILRFFTGMTGVNEFGAYYHNLSHVIYCEKIGRQIDGYNEKYRETWDGKIMGLSAYGSSVEFNDSLKEYRLSKELSHESVPYVTFNLGGQRDSWKYKNADEKAYIIQKNFECALLDYMTELKNESYLDDYVCFSGGSFLNVLGNSVLKESGLFKGIHVPPCPNDTGLHFGAACYGVFKNKETVTLPDNIALLGKEYSEEEILSALEEGQVQYEKYEDFDELCEFTALQLGANKIVGWFQGRSEFGPRALGSRSLLMHPGPAENKDIMNSRVKHREYWRPFAGIILEEHLNEYFEEDFNSPYMLYSLTVKENKREALGAITHKDNTCRIQTVNDTMSSKVTKLLQKFEKETGIPAVLNTSFNDNGEPIVESPQDAIRSFKNMDIDYLVIGNFVVRK